jgi:hypothetical protein
MRKMIIVFFIASLLASYINAADEITVRDFDVKVIDKTDLFTEVSFKIDLYNNEKPGNVFIFIHGIDREGFEIIDHVINVKFDADEWTTITDSRTFLTEKYDRVYEWKIKKIDKH